MDWSTGYLACFLFGMAFVAVTALMGHFGGGDAGGHGDGGGDAGHDLAHDMSDGVQGVTLPVFSPSVLSVFVTMFGAGGYVLTRSFGISAPLLHVSGATATSLVSGFSMAWFLMKLMKVAESNSLATHASVVGRSVEVTQSIRGAEFGEIAYEAGGARQTLIARSLNGQTFAQGEAVQVISVVEGTAFVAPVGTVSAIAPVLSTASAGTPVEAIQQKTK